LDRGEGGDVDMELLRAVLTIVVKAVRITLTLTFKDAKK
jgi:hypothetical protein